MAGSYSHCTTDAGKLRKGDTFVNMIENLGDAWEAIEEMYGMIWLLADGDPARVEDARQRHEEGLKKSPGISERNYPKMQRPPDWPGFGGPR